MLSAVASPFCFSQHPVVQPVVPTVVSASTTVVWSSCSLLSLGSSWETPCEITEACFSHSLSCFLSIYFSFIRKEKHWSYPPLLPYKKHQSAFPQVCILTVILHEPRSQPCPLQPGHTPGSACFLCWLQLVWYWREQSENWVSKGGTTAVPPLSCWMNALVLLGWEQLPCFVRCNIALCRWGNVVHNIEVIYGEGGLF